MGFREYKDERPEGKTENKVHAQNPKPVYPHKVHEGHDGGEGEMSYPGRSVEATKKPMNEPKQGPDNEQKALDTDKYQFFGRKVNTNHLQDRDG